MLLDDDFKLEDAEVASDSDEGLESTKIHDVCWLGKPGPDEFFKIYNLKNKGLDGFINGFVAKRKDKLGVTQHYLIIGSKDFKAKCRQRIKPMQYVKLLYGVTSNERLFIWPVVVVKDIGDAWGWHLTAWEIAKAALDRWSGVQSDKTAGRYIHVDLDRPEQVPNKDIFINPPKEMDYETAMKKAFKGRIVKDEDHHIYANAGTVIPSKLLVEQKKKGKSK